MAITPTLTPSGWALPFTSMLRVRATLPYHGKASALQLALVEFPHLGAFVLHLKVVSETKLITVLHGANILKSCRRI